MTQIEKLAKRLQDLQDNLTLKNDYSEETEVLNQMESDVAVLRHMNAPIWKVQDILKTIKQVKQWINDETAAHQKDLKREEQ